MERADGGMRVRRELLHAVAQEPDLAHLLQRLPIVLEQRVRYGRAAVTQHDRRRSSTVRVPAPAAR